MNKTISLFQILDHEPSVEKTTITYYDKNAETYANTTFNSDMTAARFRFTSLLTHGAHILDLGCGSGRDSLAFQLDGFNVTLADGSKGMCEQAQKLTGLNARQLLFTELDYENEFEGIWACASLLHVPSSELPCIFSLIHRALKARGLLYASFKCSDFEGQRDKRYFTDMTEERMNQLIRQLFKPIMTWHSEDASPERKEDWLNIIVQKRS